MIVYFFKFIFLYVLFMKLLRELIYKDSKFYLGLEEGNVFNKDIMVFFNLMLLIMVRVEFSYNERLLLRVGNYCFL